MTNYYCLLSLICLSINNYRYRILKYHFKKIYWYHFKKGLTEEKGLLPKKGNHAKYIEETEKVFFVQGLDNLLILFDCWINVYKKIPILPDSKLTYGLGSKVMCSKYFPMFLVDFYFMIIKNSKRHKRYAYEIFDKLLDECVLLHLDIEENIDFNFSDIDQIKSRGYRKRHLNRIRLL